MLVDLTQEELDYIQGGLFTLKNAAERDNSPHPGDIEDTRDHLSILDGLLIKLLGDADPPKYRLEEQS